MENLNEKQQIEEMARVINEAGEFIILGFNDAFIKVKVACESVAEALYNAGYRRQSEGEWIDKPTGAYRRMQSWCSACGKHSGIGGIESNRHKPYCPNCGAKMFIRMTHTCAHIIPNLIPTIEEMKGGE